MVSRKESFNVTFDLDFDGDSLAVFLSDTDVTSEFKEALGKEAFVDLENSFRPRERDYYDEWKDRQLEEADL